MPKGIQLAEVAGAMRELSGVLDVHDLHIWSLGSEAHALSCHVQIEDMPPSASDAILKSLGKMLEARFDIDHTTIQFEHVRCAVEDISCTGTRHTH